MPKKTATKKTAAKKKSSAKKATMTKADFVRSQPRDTPAKDVVAKATEAKIKLDEGYVYKIRTLDNKAAGKTKGRKTANGKAASKPTSLVAQHAEHVRALRGVILHVGIHRAKEMMDQIVRDLLIVPS